jgi:acyl-CoA synthetase (AMP-forming)/AMP-acid ligase II
VMGLSRLGATSALVNTSLVAEPLVHAIDVSGARHIMAGTEHAVALSQIASRLSHVTAEKDIHWRNTQSNAVHRLKLGQLIDDELASEHGDGPAPRVVPSCRDTYCYIYTSGTTGLPKAAIIDNQRMLGAGATFGSIMHRCAPGDLIYVPLPLYHSSAMFLGWSSALMTGAAIGLRRKFSARAFWDDVHEMQATSFLYIGELCRYLLNAPTSERERGHRLRVGVGNGMRPELWEPFLERFDVPLLREFYGSTEGNAPALNRTGRPGMIGRLGRGQAVARCDAETGVLERGANGFATRVPLNGVGLLLGRISRFMQFQGYLDPKATSRCIREDVFRKGDRWFDTGDLVQLHDGRWLSFVDRVGDTFRWKGENVSTTQVAELVAAVPGVDEANVYGVEIQGAEGRAGMAALRVGTGFALETLAAHVTSQMPAYQRPLFVRILQGAMDTTATFKHRKVEYREQAFDPTQSGDPLYVLIDGTYEPVDLPLYERIQRGEIVPG